MLVTLWSLKGGAGCSVTAALLARSRALTEPDGVVLVDLSGDQPHIFAGPSSDGAGITEWLSTDRPAPGGLLRLAAEVAPGLRLLGRGSAPWRTDDDVTTALAGQLVDVPATVVVDAGCVVGDAPRALVAQSLAAASTHSVLVTRACYLALRRIPLLRVAPSCVVLVREADRSIGADDIERAVGAPVVAELAVDPAIARAVDAGLLATRVPRGVDRVLRGVA